jgi:hypothetical protein
MTTARNACPAATAEKWVCFNVRPPANMGRLRPEQQKGSEPIYCSGSEPQHVNNNPGRPDVNYGAG